MDQFSVLTPAVEFLSLPYNVPFTFALMLASMFAVLQTFLGVIPDGIDLDIEGDADIDFGTDVDVDVEMDADGTFAHDLGIKLLGWMGVGKIPLSVLSTLFLFIFGGAGLGLGYFLHDAFGLPFVGSLGGWVWVGVCFLCSLRVSGIMASGVNKLLPKDSTTSEDGSQKIMRTAVASTDINEHGGQIKIDGAFYFALSGGEEKNIRQGARVIIVSYDNRLCRYTVEPVQ